jgi:Transposase domain (DUF772)
MRDVLGAISTDEQFADRLVRRGRPVVPPWRLALVTVLQFAEGRSDRQAAEAVRVRIDGKYALGRERADPGFDYSVLCEFRARLVQGSAEQRVLDALLEACKARGLLKARGPGGGSGLMPPMCWVRCVCFRGANAWRKRCGRRSTRWPHQPRTGGKSASRLTGTTATRGALRSSASRAAKRSERPTHGTWLGIASGCSPNAHSLGLQLR